MNDPRAANNDLVLAPGEFAYMQSTTNGDVRTNVGPSVVTQAGNDRPVRFDPKTRKFNRCTLDDAVQPCTVAVEGDYIVLENPTQDKKHPSSGANNSPNLLVGRKVIIPGPATFALYPGQSADVIPGHQLRSNQYLLCRIYNEGEAKANWSNTVVKTSTEGGEGTPPEGGDPAKATATVTKDVKVESLVQGQLFIIKGTDVSFYIPPTGVEVLQDKEDGEYVRNAVTLEQLEYAILIDENGNKRYEKGPQVVFPKPTERFHERMVDDEGEQKPTRRFRAIELNNIQGVHIKVIAPFTETVNGQETKRNVGDEYFVTGKEQAIFYPRPELSIVTYGEGNQKHYATAVPDGEARYVMDRDTGKIATVPGPTMLLPDPIHEVQVRRILTDRQVSLWYPNNPDALLYNQQLRQLSAAAPRGKSGMITEAELTRQATNAGYESMISQASGVADTESLQAFSNLRSVSKRSLSEPTRQARAGQAQGETFNRGTQYTPPRQVTIDSRFEGAPSIAVWTGYAVLVVSKTGDRRVVVGPDNVILNYDETLEVLSLSTGKPKTTDKVEGTVYLRVKNNKVSDVINVETSDHVSLDVKLSYRVNFEGDTKEDQEAWFGVENYVKFLCDHARSVLKGAVRKTTIEQFYADSTAIVRDTIVGKPDGTGNRTGMVFEENGMIVTDVEVLGVEIKDASVRQLLTDAQGTVIRQNISLGQSRKNLEVIEQTEDINRKTEEAKFTTAKRVNEIASERLAIELGLALANYDAESKKQAEERAKAIRAEEILDVNYSAVLVRKKNDAEQTLAIEKAKSEVRLKELEAEVSAVVRRFEAIAPGFTQALLALSNNDTIEKVAKALSIQNVLGGGNLAETIKKAFDGTAIGQDGIGNLLSHLGGREPMMPFVREGLAAPVNAR
jgi:major vault protein